MDGTSRIEQLEYENARLRAEVDELRKTVAKLEGATISAPPSTAEEPLAHSRGAEFHASSSGDSKEARSECVPWAQACMSAPLLARYSRQMIVPGFGAAAQAALQAARVVVVGAGGLGCPIVLLLAAAGVGHITIVDDDAVEVSNLHRQIGHSTPRAGMAKAVSLASAAGALNPAVTLCPIVERFTATSGARLLDGASLLVDASDNPATRYLTSDAAVLAGVPLVSGAALGYNGQLSVYNCAGGPCYRCLYPTPPPLGTVNSCADNGVVGAVPAAIGCLQALEAIKVITGIGKPMSGRLLVLDGEDMRVRVVKLRGRRPECAVCGEAPGIRSLEDSGVALQACGVSAVEGAPSVAASSQDGISHLPSAAFVESLNRAASSEGGGAPAGTAQPMAVLDVRSPEQASLVGLRESQACDVRCTPLRELEWDSAAVAGVVEWARGRRVHVLCRRGVDSATATHLLAAAGVDAVNVKGGLTAMARHASLPMY